MKYSICCQLYDIGIMKHKLTGRLNEVNCVVVAAKLYCVTAKQKNKHGGHRTVGQLLDRSKRINDFY